MHRAVYIWSPDGGSGLEALNYWSSALDDNGSHGHWYEPRERGKEEEENEIEARMGQNTTA